MRLYMAFTVFPVAQAIGQLGLSNEGHTIRTYINTSPIFSSFDQNPYWSIIDSFEEEVPGVDSIHIAVPPPLEAFGWQASGYYKADETGDHVFNIEKAKVARILIGKRYQNDPDLVDMPPDQGRAFSLLPGVRHLKKGEFYPISIDYIYWPQEAPVTVTLPNGDKKVLREIWYSDLLPESSDESSEGTSFMKESIWLTNHQISVHKIATGEAGKYAKVYELPDTPSGEPKSQFIAEMVSFPNIVEITGHFQPLKDGLYNILLGELLSVAVQIGPGVEPKQLSYEISENWEIIDSRSKLSEVVFLEHTNVYPFRIVSFGEIAQGISITVLDPQQNAVDIFNLSNKQDVFNSAPAVLKETAAYKGEAETSSTVSNPGSEISPSASPSKSKVSASITPSTVQATPSGLVEAGEERSSFETAGDHRGQRVAIDHVVLYGNFLDGGLTKTEYTGASGVSGGFRGKETTSISPTGSIKILPTVNLTTTASKTVTHSELGTPSAFVRIQKMHQAGIEKIEASPEDVSSISSSNVSEYPKESMGVTIIPVHSGYFDAYSEQDGEKENIDASKTTSPPRFSPLASSDVVKEGARREHSGSILESAEYPIFGSSLIVDLQSNSSKPCPESPIHVDCVKKLAIYADNKKTNLNELENNAKGLESAKGAWFDKMGFSVPKYELLLDLYDGMPTGDPGRQKFGDKLTDFSPADDLSDSDHLMGSVSQLFGGYAGNEPEETSYDKGVDAGDLVFENLNINNPDVVLQNHEHIYEDAGLSLLRHVRLILFAFFVCLA